MAYRTRTGSSALAMQIVLVLAACGQAEPLATTTDAPLVTSAPTAMPTPTAEPLPSGPVRGRDAPAAAG
ncbi:MAG: hypothetical protein ACRDGV_12670 [Candidatus Limnocylindria bacterium]